MTIPTSNPTRPSEPLNLNVSLLNGMLYFDWDAPVVRPVGTRFQVVASVNCADASVGTIAWQGDSDYAPVPWTHITTRWFWWVRGFITAENTTIYGAYAPNTFGMFALPAAVGDNSLRTRPVPDPDFKTGPTIGSYWFTTGAFSLSPTGGMVSSSGLVTLTGTSGIHVSALGPDHRSSVGYNLGQIFGGMEFPVQAGRFINWSLVYQRTTAVAGSGGQAGFGFNVSVGNIVGGSQATLALTNSANNYRRVDTISLNTWFTFTGSVQVPNSSWDRASVELAANQTTISSGTVQIGRFDAWLT